MQVQGHDGRVNSVAFSHDGMLLASASDDLVRIWRTKSGECMQGLSHRVPVKRMVFSHDSMLLASASGDGVRSWRTKSGEHVQALSYRDPVNSVTFTYLSMFIFHDSADRGWHIDSDECQILNSVAFSHDGIHLASASHNNTVRIWRTDSGKCVLVLRHRYWVNSVAFSRDGMLLASPSPDKTVRIWRTDSGDCIHTVKLGMISHFLAFREHGSQHLLFTDAGASAITNTVALPLRQRQSQRLGLPANTRSTRSTMYGVSISRDRCWVMWHGANLLWLPAEFRSACSAVSGATVGIGCNSGRVLMMAFEPQAVQALYSRSRLGTGSC
jgi:WD40 repeat protein